MLARRPRLCLPSLSPLELVFKWFARVRRGEADGGLRYAFPHLQQLTDEYFDLVITEADVFHKLIRLNQRKSTGPDNVAPRLLKEGAPLLC